MKARHAALYVRISQDREGAGLGVERQRADCEALAKKLGWDVVAVHTDNDTSAYSGKARKGYRALLADIEAGIADAVLVWHTDRLHRSPRELEEYVDLCERHKVITQTVKAGELDLATPSGRAIARTLGAWSRFEVEHKSERTKRAQLQAAQAGRWLGGGRPFGWQVAPDGSARLDRAEAREIRAATKRLLAGDSLGGIVRDLNSRGIKTSTGRDWSYTTLKQVLTRPRNAGLADFHGEIVGQSTWPAIVTEQQWRAVAGLLGDPERRRSSTNRTKYLLSGIARCSCGGRLKSAAVKTRKGETVVIYRCGNASTPGAHAFPRQQWLDDFVSRVVIARLSRPDAIELLTAPTPQVDDVRNEVLAIRAELAALASAAGSGDITISQMATTSRGLQSRLAAAEDTLAKVESGSVLAGLVGVPDISKVWDKMPLARRRAVVDLLMTVTVRPVGRGGRYDEDAVVIEWVS